MTGVEAQIVGSAGTCVIHAEPLNLDENTSNPPPQRVLKVAHRKIVVHMARRGDARSCHGRHGGERDGENAGRHLAGFKVEIRDFADF